MRGPPIRFLTMATSAVRRSTRVSSIKREPDSSSLSSADSDAKHETETSDLSSDDTKKAKPPRKKRKQARVVTDIEDLSPPANWKLQFDALREFRRTGPPAPVDTMGCDIHEHIDPKTRRLHCLISLMLSAQCKDEANALVMATLKRTLPHGLSLDDLLDIEQPDLALLIRPAGMHNNKSKFIKRVAVILRDEWQGDIPDSVEGMMALPGVGPKMAMLCMASAWDRTVGIGVDVHVHRISNLLGWVRTNAPEKTRAALETWLPRELWREINHLLVGHGQMTCKPIGRRCNECPLSQAGPLLCPSVVEQKSPRKKTTLVKRESLAGVGATSPSKQSYDARFPKIKSEDSGMTARIKLEEAVNEDLAALPEEKVREFAGAPETSPYFSTPPVKMESKE